MKYKLWLIVMCIPLYLISLIGEWYIAKTNHTNFNLKDHTKDYWEVVREELTKK